VTSKFLEWFDDRWPFRAVIRYSLQEEIPGGDSFWYCFGAVTLFVFVIQVVTGIWQLFYYVPTVDHAYQSVMYLRQEVPFGWFIHGLHYWGSNAFIVIVIIHILRVFIWGAYKYPRQLTWLAGVILFFLVMALSFTGALLPWDELGYWAAEVGTSIAGTVPVIGFFIKEFMRGQADMSQATLSRFFIAHVAILPGILAALIAFHVVAFRQFRSVGPWNREKRKKTGFFWPNQVLKDIIVVSGLFILLVALVVFWRAPVTGPADPVDNSIVPKPEWQFLFLYQFLKLFKGRWEPVGTVGVPLALFLILFLLPFYDRNRQRNPLRRPLAMLGCFALLGWFVVYTILGYYSNPGANLTAKVSVSAQASESVKAGAALFSSQGCVACHTINGQGGDVGPNLSREGSKGLSDEWLTQQIRDPKSHDKSTAMPAFGSLSDKQVNNLVDFLKSLGGSEDSSQSSGSSKQTFQNTKSSQPAKPTAEPNESSSKTVNLSDKPRYSIVGDFSRVGPAAYFVGNPPHGGKLYDKQCAQCHGKDGKGGVSNPGSLSGEIPPLNPVSKSLFSNNPVTFAENIDRIIQHGSIPPGPNPEQTMPAFGDNLKLTQQMIAEIEAYVLKLNNVDRAEIMYAGVRPYTFFAITIIVYSAAIFIIIFMWYRGKGGEPAPAESVRAEQSGKPEPTDKEIQSRTEMLVSRTEYGDVDESEPEQTAPELQSEQNQSLNRVVFALVVIIVIVVIATGVLLIFSSFVTTKPVPSETTRKITSGQTDSSGEQEGQSQQKDSNTSSGNDTQAGVQREKQE